MRSLRSIILLIAALAVPAAISACAKKEPMVDTTAEPVKIAVESSFMPTAKLLANDFTANTQIAVELKDGSNEELVNLILEGGDYDVFMASDVEHPDILVDSGKAMGDGSLVYAYGIPALYSKAWKLDWTAPQYLYSGQFTRLGIPDPDNNPYGKAGMALLKSIDVYESIENKLVYMNDENETLAQIKSRELDAGFIAYSSLSDRSKRWAWIVPATVYPPIGQGAVLITKDNINHPAEIWMGYLNSEGAQSIIRQSGYGIQNQTAVSSSN